jgi:hypothetical protein
VKQISTKAQGEQVNSTEAIGAPAKEKIRMKAQRYERGSLSLRKRKNLPDVWEFRHYQEVRNKTAYKKQIVGDIVQLP